MHGAVETTATFGDLQRLLPAGGGCAVCRYVAQSERRFFDSLFYENINDVPLRARLRAGNGFCERHIATLLSYRDPLATAILYGDLLSGKRQLLAGWRRARVPRGLSARAELHAAAIGRDCPACEAETQAARRACEVLAAGLDTGALRAAWRASDGLCWPHFVAARAECRAGRALLDEVQADRLDRLAADVQALIDSFDYRHQAARPPQVESAWRRAVAAVAGRVAARARPPDASEGGRVGPVSAAPVATHAAAGEAGTAEGPDATRISGAGISRRSPTPSSAGRDGSARPRPLPP